MRGISKDRKVKVSVKKLIRTLEENAESHEEEFKEALMEYKQACVSVLEAKLLAAKAALADAEAPAIGFSDLYQLREPQSCIGSYETILYLLQFQEETELELSVEEADKWILDNWGWRESLAESKMQNHAITRMY